MKIYFKTKIIPVIYISGIILVAVIIFIIKTISSMKLFLSLRPALIFLAFFLTSTCCFSQISCIDSALAFNGNNQYVKLAPNDIADSNFLSKLSGDYTIECLIKPNGGADFQRIFDFSYGSDYFMFLTTSEDVNHVPRFAISATGFVNPEIVDANVSLNNGDYNHIAITYSKANKLVTIFINGVMQGSGFVDIDADSVYYGTDAHDSSVNYIGLSSFLNDPQLNGNIDEFRISDTIRYMNDFTPSLPFVPDSNTVVLYHFDDGSGQMAADSSGNNYTAELGSSADADENDPAWLSCGTVLANSFLSFGATVIKDQVQLNWNAAFNINIRYYEIQRSTDAVHFTTINKIAQNGSNGNYNYSYTDMSPAIGKNYYRIKQVDANNTYVYSKAVGVNINGNGGFKIYPTIASGTIHISVAHTPSTIIIFNTNGKAVKMITLNNTEENINISALPVGNYIIKNITTNSSLKFVKQ